MQDVISNIATDTKDSLVAQVEGLLSDGLKQMLSTLINSDGELSLKQLRQSAKNFTAAELEKELAVHRYIQHWMPEVHHILESLSLSLKNQHFFYI